MKPIGQSANVLCLKFVWQLYGCKCVVLKIRVAALWLLAALGSEYSEPLQRRHTKAQAETELGET